MTSFTDTLKFVQSHALEQDELELRTRLTAVEYEKMMRTEPMDNVLDTIVSHSLRSYYNNGQVVETPMKSDETDVSHCKIFTKRQIERHTLGGIVVALSREEDQANLEPNANVTMSRTRNRTSHHYPRGICVEITQVTSVTELKMATSMEFEVEFRRDTTPDELLEVLWHYLPRAIYNVFTKSVTFIGNMPHSLTGKTVYNVNDYVYSHKLDGVRGLVLTTPFGALKIDRTMTTQKLIDNPFSKIAPWTLLDCEFMPNRTVVPFDVLYSANQCVMGDSHQSRLKSVELAHSKSSVSEANVIDFKTFYAHPGLIPISDDVDGIIFTSKRDYFQIVYKHKWEPTIDLMWQDNGYVLSDGSRFDPMVSSPDHARCNGHVYEFAWSSTEFIWKFVKERPDKKIANARKTVDNVMESIMNPVVIPSLGPFLPCVPVHGD